MASFLHFVDNLACVPPLTRGQRCVGSFACDGEVLEGEEELTRELFGHTTPKHASVFALLKGARAGGTHLAGLRVLHLALTVKVPRSGPSAMPIVAFVGPTMRHGQLPYEVVRSIVEQTPELMALVEGEIGAYSFVLRRPDGIAVKFVVLPARPQGSALRGSVILTGVITESAFVASADEGAAIDMDSQIVAAMARLVPGSQLFLESSAWRSDGTFMTMVRKAYGNADSPHLAAIATTPLMRAEHPEILALVEREMQERHDAARVEYLCEPPDTAGSSAAFPQALIDSCTTLDIAPPLTGCAARALGADHAHVRDASALVACTKTSAGIFVAEMRVIPSPSKPSEVAAKFAEVGRLAKTAIMLDGHQRPALAEHYATAQVPIIAAPEGAKGKAETYARVRELMAEGRIKLPHTDTSPEARALHAQLAAVTCKPLPGGGWSFSSPRRGGTHGDLVSAFVLAAWQLGRGDASYVSGVGIGRGSRRYDSGRAYGETPTGTNGVYSLGKAHGSRWS